MKKVLAIILTMVFALSLTACGKSQAEKNLEEEKKAASELNSQYEYQKNRYDDLKKDIAPDLIPHLLSASFF